MQNEIRHILIRRKARIYLPGVEGVGERATTQNSAAWWLPAAFETLAVTFLEKGHK